jgi:hypothetical protein
MSAVIPWMAAEGESNGPWVVAGGQSRNIADRDEAGSRTSSPAFDFAAPGNEAMLKAGSFENGETCGSRPDRLPAHQFPARTVPGLGEASSHVWQKKRDVGHPRVVREETPGLGLAQAEEPEPLGDAEGEQERRLYRGRAVAMLRRYMQYAIETGRLPSLLGREFFRSKLTKYTVVTFEDRVIFVHDMEMCLDRLDEFSREIIARHILQEHDQVATGRLLHCTERTVRTHVPIALDLLSDIMLEVGLMERIDSRVKNSCQGGLEDEISASDWEQGKNKFQNLSGLP